jgi:hypothetical protein
MVPPAASFGHPPALRPGRQPLRWERSKALVSLATPLDLAILTLGREQHLEEVVTGYGIDVEVEVEVIPAWRPLPTCWRPVGLSSMASTPSDEMPDVVCCGPGLRPHAARVDLPIRQGWAMFGCASPLRGS